VRCAALMAACGMCPALQQLNFSSKRQWENGHAALRPQLLRRLPGALPRGHHANGITLSARPSPAIAVACLHHQVDHHVNNLGHCLHSCTAAQGQRIGFVSFLSLVAFFRFYTYYFHNRFRLSPPSSDKRTPSTHFHTYLFCVGNLRFSCNPSYPTFFCPSFLLLSPTIIRIRIRIQSVCTLGSTHGDAWGSRPLTRAYTEGRVD